MADTDAERVLAGAATAELRAAGEPRVLTRAALERELPSARHDRLYAHGAPRRARSASHFPDARLV